MMAVTFCHVKTLFVINLQVEPTRVNALNYLMGHDINLQFPLQKHRQHSKPM